MSTFTVRPSNSEKETFRVKLTATSLLSLKLKPGDVVLLQLPNDATQDVPKPAMAWENSGGGMKDTIVQTSKALQELYEFKLGDRIGLSRSTTVLKDADVVRVKALSPMLSKEDEMNWKAYLFAVVPNKHDILAPGQKLIVEVGNKRGEFEVVDVGGLLGRVTDKTTFDFGPTGSTTQTAAETDLEFDFTGIGGLQNEIDQVRDQVELLFNTEIAKSYAGFQPPQGLLLYGTKGTGKTLLIETLSKSPWGSVVRWAAGSKLPSVTYPALIIVDLWGLTDSQKGISDLVSLFRDVEGTQTFVVAETRHPNNVNERFRTEETFGVELELPIPDLEKRLDILRALRGPNQQPADEQIADMAARTHGFVGRDLRSLLSQTWISAYKRTKVSSSRVNGQTISNDGQEQKDDQHAKQDILQDDPDKDITSTESPVSTIIVAQADIDQSISRIRPSALQEVFLEKPTVRWSDIGGQHALKHRLTTAVNRTISPTLRKRMLSLGLDVPKGILLYGPPGCSKTLLAKALANEAELNFLAVKGAELISMYVGESERATREVFRKARAASPSILFFDEIDAIASRTSNQGSGGGSSGLNVLTTLLNEMDGFEELGNVIVVAATNKPQQIDPALLRPGRFDHVVYVGLPDFETRREIIEKRFRNVQVEEGLRGNIEGYVRDTKGYSGAEVVAICKSAAELAMDADRDFVSVEDMTAAISSAIRGVSREVLEEYELWNEARAGQAHE